MISPWLQWRLPSKNGIAFRLLIYTTLVVSAFLIDDRAVEFLARPIRSGQLQNILRNLRCWGEGVTVVVLSVGWMLAAPKHWRVGATMAMTALGVGILVEFVKPITSRPRPAFAMNPTGAAASDRASSFPSGHTATAFAMARIWSLAIPAVRTVSLLAATGTGLSRMYEQRHYCSDCAVGGLLGWYVGLAIALGLDRLWRRRPDGEYQTEGAACSNIQSS